MERVADRQIELAVLLTNAIQHWEMPLFRKDAGLDFAEFVSDITPRVRAARTWGTEKAGLVADLVLHQDGSHAATGLQRTHDLRIFVSNRHRHFWHRAGRGVFESQEPAIKQHHLRAGHRVPAISGQLESPNAICHAIHRNVVEASRGTLAPIVLAAVIRARKAAKHAVAAMNHRLCLLSVPGVLRIDTRNCWTVDRADD